MPPKADLQLSIGYWIVSHNQTLRTWWGIMLMAIIAFSLLWMIVFFVLFFGQEKSTTSMVVRSANSLGGFSTAAWQPQALTAGNATVITRDATHVDLVAELTNPNTEWAARVVTAHFSINGVAQTPLRLFVNQGEHRPVVQVNLSTTTPTNSTAELVIDDVEWARASGTTLPAATFDIANIQLTPSTISVNGQTRTSVSVSADVTNTSVYNFFHVDVPIVLSSGDRIVGVGLVGIDRWPTLTMRPVTITLAYPVTQATAARIVPLVNRFDPDNTYR